MRALRAERGQASPEWVGLVLVVALALAALAAAGVRLPGTELATVLASRIACAAGIGSGCGESGALTLAYGAELAGLVADHAPTLAYEDGMRALPVDFRRCRQDACAEGPPSGHATESLAGEPVTAFSRVIDCRDPADAPADADCSDERAGRLYLQYWLYYPGSATARALLGDRGYHPDDWESFQVRVEPDGTVLARASSHHGYNGRSGNALSDIGAIRPRAWTEATGSYFISGGSHAGRVGSIQRAGRYTKPDAISVVPIESLGAERERYEFEVTPPWAKRVYSDPEHTGTD